MYIKKKLAYNGHLFNKRFLKKWKIYLYIDSRKFFFLKHMICDSY